MTRILALDDDPNRYDGLRSYLAGTNASLTVVACAACLRAALPGASVVLIDYDLDSGALCAACGGWPEQVKGIAYVDDIAARGIPAIVTSCSSPANVRRLVGELLRRGVRTAQHSAFEPECELRWLGRLVTWGIFR